MRRWAWVIVGMAGLFIFALAVGGSSLGGLDAATARRILWELRLPRVILAALVGGLLSGTGAVLQAVLRNPLADPYLLGVSSGAALGAVGALSLGISWPAPFAAGGAAASLIFVLGLARRKGGIDGGRLVLAGAALHSLSAAVLALILARSTGRPDAGGIFFWLLGSLGTLSGGALLGLTCAGAAVLFLLIAAAPALNLLALGDDAARGLGLPVDRARGWVLLGAAAATGLAVSFNGMIPFVGLLVPQAARLVIGGDQKKAIPLSICLGAALLAGADGLGRWVWAPQEIPTGVVTALVGAPFFLWMLARGCLR